jgi:hypothetical protein
MMNVNCELSMVNSRRSLNDEVFFSSFVRSFLSCLFFSIAACSFSQSVSATLDRDKILLGEQVSLRFNLNSLNPLTTNIETWPTLADTVNHIEIVKRNAVDTVNVNGLDSYEQNFVLTGFDSGRWELGPFRFVLHDRTTGKKINLTTQPLYLTVLPVDVSSLKDYHPIKDVIDVTSSFNWLPVIIAAAVVIAGIILYIVIKKRKKKIVAEPKIVLKGTPFERAVEKLRALQSHALTTTAEIKKFHSDIDFICRQYFEEMLHVKAMQATTSELFSRMNVYMQDSGLRSKMRQLADLHASVKFAKYMPPAEQSRSALKEVITCLQAIDLSAQQAKENANRMVSKY